MPAPAITNGGDRRNTFDYSALHDVRSQGRYSFCSASVRAVEREVSPDGYSAVDLILGEQRSTTIDAVTALQNPCSQVTGGSAPTFVVSGSYVATGP